MTMRFWFGKGRQADAAKAQEAEALAADNDLIEDFPEAPPHYEPEPLPPAEDEDEMWERAQAELRAKAAAREAATAQRTQANPAAMATAPVQTEKPEVKDEDLMSTLQAVVAALGAPGAAPRAEAVAPPAPPVVRHETLSETPAETPQAPLPAAEQQLAPPPSAMPDAPAAVAVAAVHEAPEVLLAPTPDRAMPAAAVPAAPAETPAPVHVRLPAEADLAEADEFQTAFDFDRAPPAGAADVSEPAAVPCADLAPEDASSLPETDARDPTLAQDRHGSIPEPSPVIADVAEGVAEGAAPRDPADLPEQAGDTPEVVWEEGDAPVVAWQAAEPDQAATVPSADFDTERDDDLPGESAELATADTVDDTVIDYAAEHAPATDLTASGEAPDETPPADEAILDAGDLAAACIHDAGPVTETPHDDDAEGGLTRGTVTEADAALADETTDDALAMVLETSRDEPDETAGPHPETIDFAAIRAMAEETAVFAVPDAAALPLARGPLGFLKALAARLRLSRAPAATGNHGDALAGTATIAPVEALATIAPVEDVATIAPVEDSAADPAPTGPAAEMPDKAEQASRRPRLAGLLAKGKRTRAAAADTDTPADSPEGAISATGTALPFERDSADTGSRKPRLTLELPQAGQISETLVALAPAALLALGAVAGLSGLLVGLVYVVVLVLLRDGPPRPDEPRRPAGLNGIAIPAVVGLAHGTGIVAALYILSGAADAGFVGWLIAFAAFAIWLGQVVADEATRLAWSRSRAERGIAGAIFASLLLPQHASVLRAIHRRHAATGNDPYSADDDETLYSFAAHAWEAGATYGYEMEGNLMRPRLGSARGLVNPVILWMLASGLMTFLIPMQFGLGGMLAYFLLVAAIQLQVFGALYVRHFGKQRARLDRGRTAPYTAALAWTGPRIDDRLRRLRLGRIAPARELPDGAPVLPHPFAAMVGLALLPGAFRKAMGIRVERKRAPRLIQD